MPCQIINSYFIAFITFYSDIHFYYLRIVMSEINNYYHYHAKLSFHHIICFINLYVY